MQHTMAQLCKERQKIESNQNVETKGDSRCQEGSQVFVCDLVKPDILKTLSFSSASPPKTSNVLPSCPDGETRKSSFLHGAKEKPQQEENDAKKHIDNAI